MKHQQNRRKFGRERNQRKALFSTMLGSLIMHEKIQTTEAKAKELKNKIDRIINKAKESEDKGTKMTVIRSLRSEIPLVAAQKMTGDFVKKFEKRNSGYSRVIKLPRRQGDGARMAIIELITN